MSTYVFLSHQLKKKSKLSQHCQAIILQVKKKNLKNKNAVWCILFKILSAQCKNSGKLRKA